MRMTLSASLLIAFAAPATAQDYHFTRDISAGGSVEISNINGSVEVTRAAGRAADVTVTKTVKRGDGNLVKAVMEEDHGGMRVCTVYLVRASDTRGCHDDSHERNDRHDRLEVEMHYVVHVPSGARVTVDAVNGNVSVTGVDASAHIETVNGNVDFDGTGASTLTTVNGKVTAAFTRAAWDGTMHVETVNGEVTLTFPADFDAVVTGGSVNGGFHSDFPIKVEKGWGPKSFEGRIGSGGHRLTIETVNGGITLRKK